MTGSPSLEVRKTGRVHIHVQTWACYQESKSHARRRILKGVRLV